MMASTFFVGYGGDVRGHLPSSTASSVPPRLPLHLTTNAIDGVDTIPFPRVMAHRSSIRHG